MCAGGLIVKNTFICVVGAEALSPVRSIRRRAITDPEELTSSDGFCSCSDNSDADLGSAVAELAAGLEGDSAARQAALAEVAHSVLPLSFDRAGCNVARRALEVASPSEAQSLCAGLKGHVLEAMRSPHAHQVLMAAVHNLSTEQTAFVAEELLGHGREAALNSHGSALVCHLLAFSAADARTAALVDEILSWDAAALACHKFGYRVAMSIFADGLPDQKHRLVNALLDNVQRFARHRFASPALENALLYASPEDCRTLGLRLTGQQGAIASMACHGFGVRVVKALLGLPEVAEDVLQSLRRGGHRIMKDKFGAQLLRELGLDEQHTGAGAGAQGGGGAAARLMTAAAAAAAAAARTE